MSLFPINVLDEVKISFDTYMDAGTTVIQRPLRLADPYRAVGLFPTINDPLQDSQEIGGTEPTLQRYSYRIQYLLRHADETEGRALWAVDTKAIKTILYRDTALRSRLGGLAEDMMGFRERFQKFVVGSQRYLNNELQGQFTYLSVTEFFVETEVVPL